MFAKPCKPIIKCIHRYKESDKSYILTTYISTWINVLVKQLTNEFKICLKRSRLIDTRDIIPYKKRTQEKLNTLKEVIKIIDKFKIDEPITFEKAYIEQEALK